MTEPTSQRAAPAVSAGSATNDAAALADEFRRRLTRLEDELARVVVGQREVVRQTLVAILAGGHVLLEGVPGLGKTLLCRSLAEALDLTYRRIQFTPDLMPADILGTFVVTEDANGRKGFQFQEGPIFGNLVLADEVNRATPKTQSALLEAMQEHMVTTAGERRALPDPFFVLATQNPIEMEGTYPLPEAQLDRFLLKIDVPAQGVDALVEVLRRTTGADVPVPEKTLDAATLRRFRAFVREVPCAEPMLRYAATLVRATHPDAAEAPERVRRFVRYGASPRGAQAIVLGAKVTALLAGRAHVDPDDVAQVALPALRHRVLLNFEGEADGVKVDDLVREVIAATPKVARDVAARL
jgi:MoxR-like ATPase